MADRPISAESARKIEVLVLAAVHHAVEACKDATGQRRVIDHFVNKVHIANEVMQAFRETISEANDAP